MTALGVSLVMVGAIMVLIEAHVPTLGALGGPGVIALAAGAVLAVMGLGGGVALGALAALLLAGAAGGLLVLTVGKGVAVRRRRIRVGPESLIGHLGTVRNWADPTGCVMVDGALWTARRSSARRRGSAGAARGRQGRGRPPRRSHGRGQTRGGMGGDPMILAIVILLAILAVIAFTTLGASVRVLREYERGVVFRLGRVMDLRGPGLILLVPTIDRMVRVSLRTVTLTVPPQEVIMRDNIPVRVTAVTYYRVVDPDKAVNQVENFHHATLQIAQTTLRSVLGGVDLDHLLSERDKLNESLQQVIDSQTEPWGIKVSTVEIKDVEIPERMQHAIARQAEAERERRAKIINAEGEAQAATRLADAADIIGRNPTTLQLRYLQTLREIGATQNSTVVFPMPIDLIKPVLEAMRGSEASTPAAPTPTHENGALGPAESRALTSGDTSPAAPNPTAADTAPVDRDA